MKIDSLILGAYETNSYILRKNEKDKDCVIIDTGFEDGRLLAFLQENQLNPVAVVLSHGHIDHIAGLASLRVKCGDFKVYIHKFDADMLTDSFANLSFMSGMQYTDEPADVLLEGGETIEPAGIKLEILYTPGHTPGGISLYSEQAGAVFTGDALFADSVGRTDFPGGSMGKLIEGIKKNLMTLPDQTRVYPGHGPATTIAHEKQYNQYLT